MVLDQENVKHAFELAVGHLVFCSCLQCSHTHEHHGFIEMERIGSIRVRNESFGVALLCLCENRIHLNPSSLPEFNTVRLR